MNILVAIIAFAVAIGVLVTVHEYGHYLMARLSGVRVLRFSIGFGKPLFNWYGKDGTEYVIAMLPLGGYVKMLDSRDSELTPGEKRFAFNHQPKRKRFAILVGGPLFNFLFAVLAYWAIFMLGVPGLKPVVGEIAPGSPAAEAGFRVEDRIVDVAGESTSTWQAVNLALLEGILDSSELPLRVEGRDGRQRELLLHIENARPLTEPGALLPGLGLEQWFPRVAPVVGDVQDGSPAAAAGLQAGDVVIESDGVNIESPQQWIRQIQASAGELLLLKVERDDQVLELTVTPGAIESESGERIGRIGAEVGFPAGVIERFYAVERLNPIAALGRGVSETAELSMLTLRVLGRMVIGDVSLKNISGPINIANIAGQSASYGIVSFLTFLAVISISLGILNLLPIPLLDGGQIVFLGLEAVKGSPLSPAAEALGQRIGLAMLAIFMSLAFYNDIVRLTGNGG